MHQRTIKFINDIQSIAHEQAVIISTVTALFDKVSQTLDEEKV
jgi:hypothetical protein